MLRILLVLLALSLAVWNCQAEAKGSKSSSGAAKTQHVQGYVRKDGTAVEGYWRAPAGHGGSGSSTGRSTYVSGTTWSTTSGASSVDPEADGREIGGFQDDTGWAKGLGKQEGKAAPEAEVECRYSAVMTDEEIAACRH